MNLLTNFLNKSKMPKVSSLISIPMDVIQKEIPSIVGVCTNWKPEFMSVVQSHVLRHLKDHDIRLFTNGKKEPVFDCEYLNNGRHTFEYHDPEVRVLCRKVGERMIVTTIKYESIPKE